MPRGDGMGENSGAWGARVGGETDALIQRIEIIERSRDNINMRIRKMEQHFDGDCDLIARMDILENQAMGASVDKAVFDTKMAAMRTHTTSKIDVLEQKINNLRRALTEVQDDMAVVHEELSGVQQGLIEATIALPDNEESAAIGELRNELHCMRVKIDRAMTTSSGASKGRSESALVAPQNDSDSDPDEGWGDDTPLHDSELPEQSGAPNNGAPNNGAPNGVLEATADHDNGTVP